MLASHYELGFEVKHITELADHWLQTGSLKLKHTLTSGDLS